METDTDLHFSFKLVKFEQNTGILSVFCTTLVFVCVVCVCVFPDSVFSSFLLSGQCDYRVKLSSAGCESGT